MRPTSRAAGLLALAVVAITCTDVPTGPGLHDGYGAARLALAPGFSPAAARAYGALEAMGIAVTQARIRLRTAAGTLARDTTLQFGAEDTLRLQLPVEIQGMEQTFSALIELLDAGGTVLFSQTQDVTARAAMLPAAPPPTITLEYVGPGATARAISISPSAVTVQHGVQPVLTAVGADAAGAPVTDLLLAWTSSDPTLATVTAVGRIATVRGTGRRGTVTITATSPTGLGGTARLAMLPLAARLAVVSGDAQSSITGRQLAQPLVVELQGVDGGPIPDATVAFRAVTAGATVGTVAATTDAAGRASTTLTLGSIAGTYSFEAASGAVPAVSVSAGATAAPATVLALVSGNGQQDSTGAALSTPLAVRATDESGAAVAGASIAWQVVSGSGALGVTTGTTGADGLATNSYLLGAVPGVDLVRAMIAGSTDAAAAVVFTSTTLVRGAASVSILSGGGQSGLPGATLAAPLVAAVTDARGNRLAGVSVAWQASAAGLASFSTPMAVTDANGEARTDVTLGTVAGTGTVTARVGALSASTTLGVTVGAAANLAAVAGSGPGIVGGTALLRARVTDATGNPVAGHQVGWAVTAGGGTLPFTTSTTNSLGEAEITWTLGSFVGAQTVSATSSGLAGSPAVFIVDAVAGPGSLLRLVTQPGAPGYTAPSGVVLGSQPEVHLTDATGNPVPQPGVVVGASLSNTTATLRGATTAVTDSAGVARFAGLNVVGVAGQSTAVVFSSAGYTSVTSNPLAIGPGVAATLVGLPASTTGLFGLPVSLPPSVMVIDSSGNPVSGVPIAFAALGGTIGVTAATTDASGTASSGSWVLGLIGENVVTATSGGLAGSPVTFRANGTGGLAAGLKFLTSPASTLAGSTLSPVLVAIVDASGNVVATAADQISLVVAGNRDVGLQGTTTAGAVNGIATFGDLAIATGGTAYRLEATSGTLSSALSAPFDVAYPMQAASIGLLSGPNQLLPIRGTLPADSVKFVVADAQARPLGGATVSFQLGTLSQCALAVTSAITGADGIVSTAVTAGAEPGGCEVTAIAGDARTTSKIAVYGDGVTHVWFGGTVVGAHDFSVASNWLTVGDRREGVPTSTDVALVPHWETSLGPQLGSDAALGGLTLGRYGMVDLNGRTLTTTGNVSATLASIRNGRMIAGGKGVRVSGQFDQLEVGRVDSCANDSAMLDTVSTKELRVVCGAMVQTHAEADTLDAAGSSEIAIAPNAILVVNRGVAVTGSKLTVGGVLSVGTEAVIAPATADVATNGQVQVAGRATVGRRDGHVSFADGSSLAIAGDAIFEGPGTLAAALVSLSGNATFTGTGTWILPTGQLQLVGNLDVGGGQGVGFAPSGDHLTRFVGSKPQTVTMAPGAGSFARASVENQAGVVSFKGPTSFTSDNLPLDLAAGARVEMWNGPFDAANTVQVGKAASLSLFGNFTLLKGELRLFDDAKLTVREGFNFAGVCTTTVNGVASTNVIIAGPGTINGVPASLSICTK